MWYSEPADPIIEPAFPKRGDVKSPSSALAPQPDAPGQVEVPKLPPASEQRIAAPYKKAASATPGSEYWLP